MNMRKRIRVYCSLLLILLLVSCAARHTDETVLHSLFNRSERHLRDSIFIHDSIIVYAKADTVYKDHWHTLYRDRIHTDTVLVCDTIYRDRVVEQPATTADDGVSAKSMFRFAFLVFVFVVLWKCGLLDVVSKLLKRLTV